MDYLYSEVSQCTFSLKPIMSILIQLLVTPESETDYTFRSLIFYHQRHLITQYFHPLFTGNQKFRNGQSSAALSELHIDAVDTLEFVLENLLSQRFCRRETFNGSKTLTFSIAAIVSTTGRKTCRSHPMKHYIASIKKLSR